MVFYLSFQLTLNKQNICEIPSAITLLYVHIYNHRSLLSDWRDEQATRECCSNSLNHHTVETIFTWYCSIMSKYTISWHYKHKSITIIIIFLDRTSEQFSNNRQSFYLYRGKHKKGYSENTEDEQKAVEMLFEIFPFFFLFYIK